MYFYLFDFPFDNVERKKNIKKLLDEINHREFGIN